MPNSNEFAYYVSCCPGPKHTYGVVPGSEADEALAARPAHISADACPDCLEERRDQLRREARDCECFDDVCADGCAYAKDIADLPKALRGLVYIGMPNMAS